MGDLRTSIILDLAGNLQSRARQFTSGLDRLGRRGSASMRLLGRGVAMAGRGLDRLGNRYTALITGAAGIGAIHQVGNLEERLTRLGIQADRSADDMQALKKAIFDTAKAPQIRVDPGQIISAVEEIIEKTGDLKFAEENIRNIGLAISATGAEGTSIGGILAEFQKMGLSAKEAFEALDILNVQGKAGAFTLKDIAALGPRVVTAYTAMGRGGVAAIREMGAVLQVIRQGTGSSEQAATSFEALMRVLGDADKAKLLKRGGIKVFDPEALKEGRKVLRPINMLMKELIQRTRGDRSIIQQVLGDSEAVRGFNAAVSEFSRTGGVESLDRFYRVQADGSTTTRDSALEVGKTIAMVTAPLVLAQKLGVFKLGGALVKCGLGGKMSGVPGLSGMAGVVPVYVVNKQMSLLNDGKGFGVGTGAAGGAATSVASGAGWWKALGYAGMLGATVGTFSLATNAARAQVDKRLSDYDIDTLASTANKWARIGSTHMYEYRQSVDLLKAAQMRGELKISIDSRGRVNVDKLSGENLDIDVDSGRMMVGH